MSRSKHPKAKSLDVHQSITRLGGADMDPLNARTHSTHTDEKTRGMR